MIADDAKDRRRAEGHRPDRHAQDHADQQERTAAEERRGRREAVARPDRGLRRFSLLGYGKHVRPALPSRAISSRQNRRPGSPPRGTTVAGQRRDLTGLRWYCITTVTDRGGVTVSTRGPQRQAPRPTRPARR